MFMKENEIAQSHANQDNYQINPGDYFAILNGDVKKPQATSIESITVKNQVFNNVALYRKQELARYKSMLMLGILGITVVCSLMSYTLATKNPSVIVVAPSQAPEQNIVQDEMAIKYAQFMSYQMIQTIDSDKEKMSPEFINQFTAEGFKQYLIDKARNHQYVLSKEELADLNLIAYSGLKIKNTENAESYQINIRFKAKDKIINMNLNVLKDKDTGRFLINGIS
jgi:hypothetical protein